MSLLPPPPPSLPPVCPFRCFCAVGGTLRGTVLLAPHLVCMSALRNGRFFRELGFVCNVSCFCIPVCVLCSPQHNMLSAPVLSCSILYALDILCCCAIGLRTFHSPRRRTGRPPRERCFRRLSATRYCHSDSSFRSSTCLAALKAAGDVGGGGGAF